MKRGGPLKRYAQLVRKTGMRAVTVKQRADQARWEKVKARRVARIGHVCEAKGLFPGGCGGGLIGHHVLPKGRGGRSVDSNCRMLCVWCHRHVHDHPAEAEQLGLLRRPVPRGARVTTLVTSDAPTFFDPTGWVRERVTDDDPETAA